MKFRYKKSALLEPILNLRNDPEVDPRDEYNEEDIFKMSWKEFYNLSPRDIRKYLEAHVPDHKKFTREMIEKIRVKDN